MSEVNHSEPMDAMENPGMTEEEQAALEAERQAAYEAELAPFKALKERMDATTRIIAVITKGSIS